LFRTVRNIMISTAVANYVLRTNCCRRHWTLALGSFNILLFIVYCTNPVSLLPEQIYHYCYYHNLAVLSEVSKKGTRAARVRPARSERTQSTPTRRRIVSVRQKPRRVASRRVITCDVAGRSSLAVGANWWEFLARRWASERRPGKAATAESSAALCINITCSSAESWPALTAVVLYMTRRCRGRVKPSRL